ncbi:TSUP family transporter [Deferribacterales bacterium RsTz2092]
MDFDLSITSFLIVCPLVFLAGLVDAVGGGGGLIALPAYILAGVPIHYALGTNKLSGILGTATATYRYYKNNFLDMGLAVPCLISALIGSAIGANLTLLANEKLLGSLLLIVLPVATFYVIRDKTFTSELSPYPRHYQIAGTVAISFFLGAYDGFYGPGTGTFLALLYGGLVKMDIRTATGNAKFINVASNVGALAVFLTNGKAIIPLGLCAGLFSILGGYVGSGLVITRGSKVVRPIIVGVLTLLMINVAYNTIIKQ